MIITDVVHGLASLSHEALMAVVAVCALAVAWRALGRGRD